MPIRPNIALFLSFCPSISRLNKVAKEEDFSIDVGREIIGFAELGGRSGGEHTGVGFVGIYSIYLRCNSSSSVKLIVGLENECQCWH